MEFNNIQPLNDTERLILLRRRLNLSQFQFAKELGISTSYLGQVERGTVILTPNLKEKIINYLEREIEIYEQGLLGDI